MQKAVFAIAVLALIVFILYPGLHPNSGPRVVVEGASITMDSGADHIEGTFEPESTFELLMKDEGIAANTFSGNAFVTVLPLQTAERFRDRYGDFFTCNQPGAIEAIRSMRAIVLVTDNSEAARGITEALRLVRASRIPVVRFHGARIRVTKHTSMSLNVVDNTGTVLYYAKNFEILKPDYLQVTGK